MFSVRGNNFEINTTAKGQQVATEGAILLDTELLLEVIPGEEFAHCVTIKDDLDQDANVVLSATIPHSTNVKIDAANLLLCGRDQSFFSKESHVNMQICLYKIMMSCSTNQTN